MSLHCIVWCCMVLYCWLWRAGCISQDTYLLYWFDLFEDKHIPSFSIGHALFRCEYEAGILSNQWGRSYYWLYTHNIIWLHTAICLCLICNKYLSKLQNIFTLIAVWCEGTVHKNTSPKHIFIRALSNYLPLPPSSGIISFLSPPPLSLRSCWDSNCGICRECRKTLNIRILNKRE